jgi:hypothetical protein
VAEAVPPEDGQESGRRAKPALRRVRLGDDRRRAGTGFLPALPEPLAPRVGKTRLGRAPSRRQRQVTCAGSDGRGVSR